MKYLELSEKIDELEQEIKEALIYEIAESEDTCKYYNALCLKVNLFDYTELAVINGKLCFLDRHGYQYDLDNEATLWDLIDILNKIDE